MRSGRGLILGAMFALFLLGFSTRTNTPQYQVKITTADFRKHESLIRQLQLDVAGVSVPNAEVFLIVDDHGLNELEKIGIVSREAAQSIETRAPDAKYKTPEAISNILHQYANLYPSIATVFSIGQSLEGRDIWALKITGPTAGLKPSILFNGMHHAREVMTPEVPLDIAEYLLAGYGKDPDVTRWVDTNQIYLVPMLNVDGNNKVWTQNSYWRKNTRGGHGVDLNRNYPYKWNTCNGSSSYPSAQDYRGTAPASEPETNVMMSFVASIRPVFDISFHSFSELVIYPYGCGEHTETKEIVEPLGHTLASLLPSDDGSGTYSAGTPPELLYRADGGDIDWMYHEHGVIPYVIELNSAYQGFQPSYDQWRDKTVQKLRPVWWHLLTRLSGSMIKGKFEAKDRASMPRELRVESLDRAKAYAKTARVGEEGSFFVVVNPGTYRVSYREGEKLRERVVRVERVPVVL